MSSLPAPKIYCISVLTNGHITMDWEKVNDPSGIFNSYKIYLVTGTSLSLIHTINNINTTTFTHTSVNGNIASIRYVIGTTCSSSVTNYSDTISSIRLRVNNPNNGLAILNWNKIFNPSNSPSASNWYKIYQEYPLGTWTLIDSTQYGNEYYRDTITICNDSINYKITNFNTNCTSTSSISGSNFKDVIPPSSPIIKKVSVDQNNKATISWYKSHPNDTEGYIILKNIGGSWIPVDTVYGANNLSYTYPLSNAEKESECYGIAAFDSCWYGSPLSPNTSAMGIPNCSIYLSLNYSACDKTINLNWNQYSTWKAGVKHYQVTYTINGNNEKIAGTTNNTSFQLNNVYPDSNYCIIVKAISNNLIDTSNSNKKCIFTRYPVISNSIYLQTTTVIDEENIELRIYNPTNNQVSGYNIERSENGSNYKQIDYISNSNTNPLVYNDNISTKEINYLYKINPIDSCGNNTTNESNIGKTIFLNTNYSQFDYTNKLNWSKYEEWEGGVKEYNIYRKLGNNKKTLIATVSSTTLTYTDNISQYYSSSDDGNFCYFVEAVENINKYSISEISTSNKSCSTPDYIIYVPNSIVINGFNPIFKPVIGFANFNSYSLRVFNRLGKEIFYTSKIEEGWDGTYSGKVVQQSIYIYEILIENSEGKPIQKSGTIMVLIK